MNYNDKNTKCFEIAKEQCRILEHVGIRNFIFMLRMLGESAVELKRDIYFCFLDHIKVRHEEKTEILQNLDLDVKEIELMWN